MHCERRVTNFRPVLCGVIAALLGFSWAVATQADSSGARGLESLTRGVGSGLRFSNPFLLPGQDASFPSGGDVAGDPDGFDLGDATFGSSLTRYLVALGGVRPYSFTSTEIGAGSSVGLNLERIGRVTGTIPAASNAPGAMAFRATVTDAAGGTRLGYFRVNTQATSVFRFAQDRVPGAQVGLDYVTKLETIGGELATYTVLANSVQLNGVAQPNLEAVGLTLFLDGTIAGRPLNNGTLTFTARATRNGVAALNRAGTAPDQAFALSIGAQTSIQSVLATTRASIRGSFVRGGKDQFELQAQINTDGLDFNAFRNAVFTVRFAGAAFSTQLDGSGQAKRGDIRVGIKAPKGDLRVRIKNVNLAALFNQATLPDGSAQTVVVQVQIGGLFLGTEPIEFFTQNRRGAFRFKYQLGRNRQLGGLFQITRLDGLEFFNGTAFKARFLLSPVNNSLGNGTLATVNIGPNFTQTVQLFRGQGKFAPGGLRSMKINTKKLSGELTTYELTEAQTGIKRPSQAGGQQQTFLLGLRLETDRQTFFGEAARRILPFVFR